MSYIWNGIGRFLNDVNRMTFWRVNGSLTKFSRKGSVKYSVFRPRCFSRIWTLSSRQIEKRILMGFLFSKSTTSTFLCSGHEKWPILENATTNRKNEDDITFLMIWSIFEPNMMVIRRDFMWNDSTLMNHILSEFCANTRAQSAINISNVKQ